jgi:hypothetical protein
MSTVGRERLLRWSAVAAGTGLLVATPVLLAAAPVPGTDLTPEQVVAAAQRSEPVGWSGLVEVDGRLGLPDLAFLSPGTQQLDQHTRVRAWWASPTAWRTDSLSGAGQLTQLPVIGGTETYDSQPGTVTVRDEGDGPREPRTVDLMPGPAARTLLGWLGDGDRVEALSSARVAGVVAAGARVVPGDARSSVGRLDVWVDPGTGLPLAVEVYARGSTTPAFASRLVDVTIGRPDPAELRPELATQRWGGDPRDLLGNARRDGRTTFPPTFGGLPAVEVAAAPTGLATYGTGYVRLAVLEVPGRYSGRIGRVAGLTGALDLAGVSVRPRTVDVAGTPVAVLGSPLVQVAVVQGRGGSLYVLAGTWTADAMDRLLRSVVPAVRGWGAR